MFFHKTLHFKILLYFFTKHLNPSNYKPCLYNLFVYLYTKNIKVFFTKHYISKSSCVFFFHKHTSTINPVLQLICVSLHKKYQRPSCVFFTKTTFHIRNTKIRVTINPVYTTYLCIFTQKIPKTVLCFFHKNTTFQKSSCVFSQNTTFHIRNT